MAFVASNSWPSSHAQDKSGRLVRRWTFGVRPGHGSRRQELMPRLRPYEGIPGNTLSDAYLEVSGYTYHETRTSVTFLLSVAEIDLCFDVCSEML